VTDRSLRSVLELGMAACLLVLAALLCPPRARAEVVRGPHGQVYGVLLRHGLDPASLPGAIRARVRPQSPGADDGDVSYQGGPVLHTTAPYLVFWDPDGQIPAASEALMERYLTDTAATSADPSDVFAVARQYYDTTGAAGTGQTFVAAHQAIVDSDPYPALDTANCNAPSGTVTNCVTDPQIQTELANLIKARGLPTGTGAGAPIYFVITPSETDVCADGLGCASTGFCAYHSSFVDPDTSTDVLYAPVPFLDVDAGAKGCQDDGTAVFQSPNGDRADNEIDDLSHEYNESVTDPFGTSWYDTTSGQEIADNCESEGTLDPADGTNPDAYLPTLGGVEADGTLYDQLINGDRFYTQTIWSNGDEATGGCRAEPTADPSLSARLTDTPPANGAGGPVAFDPALSDVGAGLSSWSLSYGDGSAPEFVAGGGAPAESQHTYAKPGTYVATLTLIDIHGNASTDTVDVTVSKPPPPQPIAGEAPSITGTVQGGSVLTRTTNGRWTSVDPLTYTAQWERCIPGTTTTCTAIAGATGWVYRLQPADVGDDVTVVMTATDAYGQTATETATAVGPVTKPPPPRAIPSEAPVITGSDVVADVLTRSTNGRWTSPDPLTYAAQWERCVPSTGVCSAIAGATGWVYRLRAADLGDDVTVVVTAADAFGQTATETATAVGPIT
jgi:hypothetical protein